MEVSLRAWVALGLLSSQSPRYKSHINPHTVRPEGLLESSAEALGNALALRPQEARDIFSRNFPERADKEIEAAGKAGVAIVTFEDAVYPHGLRNLPDPPPFLYVRGKFEPDDEAAVAIVGSRRATPYGVWVAGEIGRGLAATGVTVVSGLARGIDTAAHRAALEAGGRTIAVLGSGIDIVYPKENRRMFERVARAGAVVTEFPFGAPPEPYHFPVRNRLISALSAAVVVVEAARDSGSLITARLAGDELGLPVCAVPGPITSQTSMGCNDLIYDGAAPVRDLRDVLAELPERIRSRAARTLSRRPSAPATPSPRRLDGGAEKVLRSLKPGEPRSVDELAGSMNLASEVVLGHLLELELLGLAGQLPGGLYVRKS